MTPRRNIPAFTLIELLLASALAAMLMVGLLAVTKQLGRNAVARANMHDGVKLDRTLDILRRDLAQCSLVRQSDDGIALRGYASLDEPSRELSQKPVEILYRIVSTDDADQADWLVRIQKSNRTLTNESPQLDVICRGIHQLALSIPMNGEQEDVPLARAAIAPIDTSAEEIAALAWTSIPTTVRVAIWTEADTEPATLRRKVVVR
ncbi:MAG: prepilin-type N-terminal cleavage/methylation domain-containing protein [Phycisphaeraceae bacterium]|nr:prepilin-type N-terminal cleavage/methylation domain-containing protein [Phycisphaeraceae bacterium]